MVREIRVPSSSSSSSARPGQLSLVPLGVEVVLIHTDGHGLDLDAVLDMGAVGVVGVLVADHRLAAEGVDEGGPAWKAPISR